MPRFDFSNVGFHGCSSSSGGSSFLSDKFFPIEIFYIFGNLIDLLDVIVNPYTRCRSFFCLSACLLAFLLVFLRDIARSRFGGLLHLGLKSYMSMLC